MRSNAVAMGIFYLVLGNLVAVFSDALVKVLDPDQPVFQFVFFRQVSAALMLLPLLLWSLRRHPPEALRWHLLRSHIWAVGVVMMVIALTRLPLATANALFYAAPLLMVPLAVWLAGEALSRQKVLTALLGFAGVLIVLRPTEVNWAALAALGVALTMALNNLLIKRLPSHQPVVQTLFFTNVLSMPLVLALAWWEGEPWQWQMLGPAFGSSALIVVYAGLCVLAYRQAEASRIASAEYTGLLVAVGLGVWLFGEQPDLPLLIGSLCIVLPLIAMARSGGKPDEAPKKAQVTSS
ncbi:DMT family transporter [Aeromonas simiae]|uniref:DMT family transporter n=1 Tax=Aeromonas simiae TaxID=218936 RepID=UPI00266D2ED7|nr:DMT family transporter [Aeromonas simiae]MDO2948941.1 DMT family transporter [Aeromonas simiae]MDO2952429.1 DMT family transporter [Aeromonas simiae]MDO2956665.1 DMT family transporter [Aeromonas simiae]